ncbi:PepSY domain-containing protein [Ferruginivarius sediminum]|uniref:PepSY domain-containing protein n=1 Tax=Ferruginivarius sediminum TaxID=2661937 RepID=A0A369TF86_9PROT|nr:PepSY domain-containing protein [Ferruginivarius sediminum]RDD62777.1 PepSY domain-containing protein [Ferruginivarius sediminum]
MMNFGKVIAFALIAGAVAVGGTALAQQTGKVNVTGIRLAASGESDGNGPEAGKGERFSVPQVAQRVSEQGYTDITEVELEDGNYEIKARDKEGRWVEIYVDGRTGKVMHSEVD